MPRNYRIPAIYLPGSETVMKTKGSVAISKEPPKRILHVSSLILPKQLTIDALPGLQGDAQVDRDGPLVRLLGKPWQKDLPAYGEA